MQAVDTEKQNTASATKVENTEETKEPEVQVKPGSEFKFTPIKFDAQADSTATKDAAAKSEAEKRQERAKRFGVPVKDEVKKELRAQKFGGNTAPETENSKSPSPAAVKPAQVRNQHPLSNYVQSLTCGY
jgi:SAP domain-containing ribonucleoprotein